MGTKNKLSNQHLEIIKEKTKEGKTPDEIAQFLREEQDVDVSAPAISYWKRKLGIGGSSTRYAQHIDVETTFLTDLSQIFEEMIQFAQQAPDPEVAKKAEEIGTKAIEEIQAYLDKNIEG